MPDRLNQSLTDSMEEAVVKIARCSPKVSFGTLLWLGNALSCAFQKLAAKPTAVLWHREMR